MSKILIDKGVVQEAMITVTQAESIILKYEKLIDALGHALKTELCTTDLNLYRLRSDLRQVKYALIRANSEMGGEAG